MVDVMVKSILEVDIFYGLRFGYVLKLTKVKTNMYNKLYYKYFTSISLSISTLVL